MLSDELGIQNKNCQSVGLMRFDARFCTYEFLQVQQQSLEYGITVMNYIKIPSILSLCFSLYSLWSLLRVEIYPNSSSGERTFLSYKRWNYFRLNQKLSKGKVVAFIVQYEARKLHRSFRISKSNHWFKVFCVFIIVEWIENIVQNFLTFYEMIFLVIIIEAQYFSTSWKIFWNGLQ